MSRNIFLFGVIALSFFSCKQTETKEAAKKDSVLSGDLIKNPNTLTGNEEKLPELTFETTSHDFGKLTEGDKVEYDFRFTNTGEAPLLISDVKASCGCTTPDWPKGVIKAGQSDVVKVVYNSQGHLGTFSKGIVVTANTYPNQTLLKITGVVFKK
ncbi:MAG: DUF1573 domain-containing protein [Chitinophagales bacterium]